MPSFFPVVLEVISPNDSFPKPPATFHSEPVEKFNPLLFIMADPPHRISAKGIKNSKRPIAKAIDAGILVPNIPGDEEAGTVDTGFAVGWLISISKILFKIREMLHK
jgi:hypothetical protein